MAYNVDHQDEALLSVAMFLISEGEPRDKVISMLTNFGWDENMAKFAVNDIVRFTPDQKFQPQPSLASILTAFFLVSVIVFFLKDQLFVLPDDLLGRAVGSLSIGILFPVIFLLFLVGIAAVIGKVRGD